MKLSATIRVSVPPRALSLVSEEMAREVACPRCGAPAGQWCSRSYARASGGTISSGDWRMAHAGRQRAAVQKAVDDHRRGRRAR